MRRRSFRPVPRAAVVTGDLTFHGVTRPLELQAKFNAAGPNPLDKAYTTGFEVSGDLKRSDYGVKTYLPVIGDEVTPHRQRRICDVAAKVVI